jgi:hypothetical protein
MSRILNVAAIGGMETGAGNFSAQIVDPLCPWNEGAWHFEARAGKLQVEKASKAECQLTVQGLSALIAGTRDPQDFYLRGWGDPNFEIQTIMRGMFPGMSPFLHENF